MKKFVALVALVSCLSVFAQDVACVNKCNNAFTQTSLMCHKAMQMCMKNVARLGDEGAEMCYDDYQSCVAGGRDAQKSCLVECK